MKKTFLLALLSLLMLFVFANTPHIDRVRVDDQNSTVKWIGSKIAESHEGLISIQNGVLLINHGTLVGGDITINMSSIQTTDMSDKYNKKLDSHLKNEDFFDVEKHPISTIKITKATKTEANNYEIVADLTIKGITHSIIFDAEVNIRKSVFFAKAKIKIDRTKWDIKYKSGNFFKDLGDKVILDEIEFEINLLSAS
jgi:polyisoprenoid-binding protein YceI